MRDTDLQGLGYVGGGDKREEKKKKRVPRQLIDVPTTVITEYAYVCVCVFVCCIGGDDLLFSIITRPRDRLLGRRSATGCGNVKPIPFKDYKRNT
jgi:hypothetical protein